MTPGELESEGQPATVPKITNLIVSKAETLLGDIPLKIGIEDPQDPSSLESNRRIESQSPAPETTVPERPLPQGYFVGVELYAQLPQ